MPTSFVEIQFDPGIVSYGVVGGAMFKTNVVTVESGIEQRSKIWQNGRSRYEYGERSLPQSELKAIQKFFRARGGRAVGFRFRDLSDYTADNTEGSVGLTGLGNTTAGPFQIYKNYGDAGGIDQRMIRKPIGPGFILYKNGVAQTPGTHYTIDLNTGLVTFITPFPTGTDVLSWSGQFDVPVRFDTDEIKFRLNQVQYVNGIPAQGITGVFCDLMSLPLVEIIV